MKHIILGTAGHIDHGKTTLIKALTGIFTDRLPEEQDRGITIELGFAYLQTDEDIRIGIVDVPGHEKFVHHMVKGVGGMDIVMMVIAADEGVMPQTREHLEICKLLGVKNGIVAMTKTDLVDEEWLELVLEDTRNYLKETVFAGAPILPVSATTGDGIERLKQQLTDLAGTVMSRSVDGVFRLPVDRVFSMKGFGTVVTGTVNSGSLSSQEPACLVPGRKPVRIRGMQVHNDQVDSICAGQRAAVNLQGITKEEIQRGMVLSKPGHILQSGNISAIAEFIQSMPRKFKNRSTVRFHLGTTEVLAKAVLLDRELVEPGNQAFMHFILEEEIAVLPGDRFLIRSYSPVTTIGGGTVIDMPERPPKRYQTSYLDFLKILIGGSLEEQVKARVSSTDISGATLSELDRVFPNRADTIRDCLESLLSTRWLFRSEKDSDRYIAITCWDNFKHRIGMCVEQFHREHPLRLGIPKEALRSSLPEKPDISQFSSALRELLNAGGLAERENLIFLAGFEPVFKPAEKKWLEEIEGAVRVTGNAGIHARELNDQFASKTTGFEDLYQLLIDEKRIVRLPGGLLFHAETMNRFRNGIIESITASGPISVGGFRDAFEISRKQAVPILEYFDNIGLTRRTGDTRVLRQQTAD